MRVALSITPTDKSSGNAKGLMALDVPRALSSFRDGPWASLNLGIATKIATAATDPRAPRIISAWRHGSTMNIRAAAAGKIIFPMSPAKL
jgi:hypothetical protein